MLVDQNNHHRSVSSRLATARHLPRIAAFLTQAPDAIIRIALDISTLESGDGSVREVCRKRALFCILLLPYRY